MARIEDGVTGTILASVDTRNKSLRVNNRPIISNTLGGYAKSLNSGLMAAALAANATVWSFRYTGANLCIVTKVIFDGLGVITALTAGQAVGFSLFAARAFTGSATTGTGATLTGNNAKLRTSYATTAVGDIRISATAALTAGTRTLDTDPMGGVFGGLAAAGSFIPESSLFDAYKIGHPVVLANNEGLELQNRIAWPVAGTFTFGVTVQWDEVTAAEWES